MGVLPPCISVHHVHAVSMEARRGCQVLRNCVTDNGELPCGCWESNPGPLQEDQALFTAEPYL